MTQPPFRKPRQYFDTAVRPVHVTFDDGKNQRRNFPWAHYVEARWDYAEPDTLKLEIGDWLVVVTGHNLAALFLAIEDHTLARLRAQPDLARDPERRVDAFATEIRFLRAPSASPRQRGQVEFDLGAE